MKLLVGGIVARNAYNTSVGRSSRLGVQHFFTTQLVFSSVSPFHTPSSAPMSLSHTHSFVLLSLSVTLLFTSREVCVIRSTVACLRALPCLNRLSSDAKWTPLLSPPFLLSSSSTRTHFILSTTQSLHPSIPPNIKTLQSSNPSHFMPSNLEALPNVNPPSPSDAPPFSPPKRPLPLPQKKLQALDFKLHKPSFLTTSVLLTEGAVVGRVRVATITISITSFPLGRGAFSVPSLFINPLHPSPDTEEFLWRFVWLCAQNNSCLFA